MGELSPVVPDSLRVRLLQAAREIHSRLGFSPHADLIPERMVDEVLDRARRRMPAGHADGSPQDIEAEALAQLAPYARARWNDVVGHYTAMLRAYGRIHWADWDLPAAEVELEDLVSEVWAKAQAARGQFKGTSEGEYVTWLYRILENHVRDTQRFLTAQRRDRRNVESLEAAILATSRRLGDLLADPDQPRPSLPVRREEWWGRALAEIERLPAPLRDYIVLWIRRTEPDEIVKELKLPDRAAMANLHLKTIRTLRPRMESLKGGW